MSATPWRPLRWWHDQGLSLDDIRCGLLTYEGLAMRQQIHELERLTVIDDSYNASPDSIKSGIRGFESGKERR